MFRHIWRLLLWEVVAVEYGGRWYVIMPEHALQFITQNYWLWPVQDFWFGHNYRGYEVLNFFW